MAGLNGVPTSDGELTRYRITAEYSDIRDSLRAAIEAQRGPADLRDPSGGLCRPSLTRRQCGSLVLEHARDLNSVFGRGRGSRSDYDIIYVNGMATNGAEHQRGALTLAAVTSREVTGVYNRTAIESHGAVVGGLGDFLQCITDYSLPVGEAASQSGIASLTQTVTDFLFGDDSTAARYNMGRTALGENDATVAVYEKLYGILGAGWSPFVVCHSQGNLIVSNALWTLKWVFGGEWPAPVKVYGLASPAPTWPEDERKFKVKLYNRVWDPVAWLSGMFATRSGRSNYVEFDRAPSAEDAGAADTILLDQHAVVGRHGYMNWRRFHDDIRVDLVRYR